MRKEPRYIYRCNYCRKIYALIRLLKQQKTCGVCTEGILSFVKMGEFNNHVNGGRV